MRNIKIYFLLFLISACAQIQTPVDHHEKLERDIASTDDESCHILIRKIITKSGNEISRRYAPESLSRTSYRMNLLNELEDKYRYTDSVLDFPQSRHLPIEDSIKVVNSPEEGLLAKVMMIRKAKKSIDLTYFLFDQSEASKVILYELKEAAKRGVKIRILYDPVGSKLGTAAPREGIPEDLMTLVSFKGRPIVDDFGVDTGKNADIEVVQFNPVFRVPDVFKKWFHAIKNFGVPKEKRVTIDKMAWNNRIHDKILLIDAESPEDSLLITGGRNVSDAYFHLNHSFEQNGTMPVMDIEVIIRGTSQRDENGAIKNDILDQFNRIYYARANIHLRDVFRKLNQDIIESLSHNREVGESAIKNNLKLAKEELRKLRAANFGVVGAKHPSANKGKFEDTFKRMREENYLDEGFENATVSVLHEVQNLTHNRNLFRPVLSVSKKENPNSIRNHIFDQFSKANKTIDIVSPYFWLDADEAKFLADWLKHDPSRKLRIISNSVLSTDSLISQTVVENAFERIQNVMKKEGVWNQVDLRVIGKEDHEFLTKNGKVYGFLHGKVYVTDRTNIVVSTSNLDPISRDINSEIGVSFKFQDENAKNLKSMMEFVEFVHSKSTQVGTVEYERMMSHPNIQSRIRRMKAAKWIVEKLGLLHVL